MKDRTALAAVTLAAVVWTGLGYYGAIRTAVQLHRAHDHRERLTRLGVPADAVVYERLTERRHRVRFRFYYAVTGVSYRGTTDCRTKDGCPQPATLAIRYDPARPGAYLIESTGLTDMSESWFNHWPNIPLGLVLGSVPLYYYLAVKLERPTRPARPRRTGPPAEAGGPDAA